MLILLLTWNVIAQPLQPVDGPIGVPEAFEVVRRFEGDPRLDLRWLWIDRGVEGLGDPSAPWPVYGIAERATGRWGRGTFTRGGARASWFRGTSTF